MFAPNWSVKGEYMYYDFGSTRFVTPAALAPFGSFHTDDHTLKLGVNYRFNFASPGGRTLLIVFQPRIAEGRLSRRPFVFGPVFRFTEKSDRSKQSAVKNAAKSLPIPNLLTGYRDTAARGNISR